MGGVAEDVRSRLVDGHCAGVRGGIGLLLADVELKGLKLVVAHDHNLFLYVISEF